MNIKKLKYSIGLTSLLLLLLSGCSSMSIEGDTSGYGTAQNYGSYQFPMAYPPKPSTPSSDDLWAAVALTKDMRVLNDPQLAYLFGIGIVKNYATAQEAKDAAMRICESDGIAGCEVKVAFQAPQCLAFAYDYNHLFYAWAVARTLEDADKKVQRICNEQQAGSSSCRTISSICPNPANTPKELPFAQTNPENAASLAYDLAVFARNAATLRNQNISTEEVIQTLNISENDDAGTTFLKSLYQQEVQLVYGPFKNISPEEIYKLLLFTHLYEMME